jgi:hypothetical protein
LVAHVGAVGVKGQPRSQIHQVSAAHVEHGRDQERQLRPLRLALLRQPAPQFRTDALRDFLDAGHHVFPGSAKGEILESHTDATRQQPSPKLIDGKAGTPSFP